ncbi:hypothetical protein [Legionella worsleiensis]|uniref:Uncharacterized protein n=1 Tax=Legionella worsleiensis TaxID=45076 RepID=A0A0W1A657_9GAMM|nr:hypothetical protein [Legionella worsleiensis]KTD76850.1 hypothetical protein Lwor_2075 [Legionella worsleiensis]STY30731.1 Uncharacterised protein [Legionella worsleiensis]
MPLPSTFQLKQIETDFRTKFIAAIEKDIESGKHASETNYYAFRFGLALLQRQAHNNDSLSLEQTIRGLLNWVVITDNDKYGYISPSRVTQYSFDRYNALHTRWTADIDRLEYLNECKGRLDDPQNNLPVYRKILQNTAQGPLIIVPNCAKHTLAVYFEYAKKLDHRITIPAIPTNHFNLKQCEDGFNLQFFEQEVRKGYLVNAKQKSKEQLLSDLKQIINNAKNDYVDHSNAITFSLFHRHGNTGRTRAEQFARDFESINDLHEAQNKLFQYLQNDRMGNTHPHSFRTMLLAQLTGLDKTTYQTTSKAYTDVLNEFIWNAPRNNLMDFFQQTPWTTV